MSVTFTSPENNSPLRSAAALKHPGLVSIMRRRAAQFAFALAGVAALSATAAAEEAYELEGYWLQKDGQSIVEIAPCTTSHKRLCGTVVWSGAEGVDVGATVLQSFRLGGKRGGDKWEKGKIFAEPGAKGKKGKLSFAGDTLQVSTCKGSRCKTDTWTRPSAAMTAEAGLAGGAGR